MSDRPTIDADLIATALETYLVEHTRLPLMQVSAEEDDDIAILLTDGRHFSLRLTELTEPEAEPEHEAIPRWITPAAPVAIPADVREALEVVRSGGVCNMLDRRCVIEDLWRRGEDEAAEWVVTHPSQYGEGIFRGFAVEGES
jgi:hypothetical protein